jgi:hypothetical protein
MKMPQETEAAAGQETIEKLLKRSDEAWKRKERSRALMQDVFDFAQPERQAYVRTAEGSQRGQKVFDSTAVISTTRFANRLQDVLCPPFQRWALLKPGQDVPRNLRRALAAALEAKTEAYFQHIHSSNFDTAFNEMAHELAAGTGVLLIENGHDGDRHDAPALRFTAHPAANVAYDEGPFGDIEGIFHKLKMPARNVARFYPGGTLPREMAELAAGANPETEVEIENITYYDPAGANWRFCAICPKSKAEIETRTYRTRPWIVIRWLKAPGEVEGRGPLIQALPDIKTLNKVVELVLKNASLAVTGVYTAADDGVLNPATVAIRPGAVIPVGRNAGHPSGPSLAPLERAADFQIAQIVAADLRRDIKALMFDNQLPDDGKVRSATEIIHQLKQLSRDIGSAFGRLNRDGLVPIMVRVADILDETGEVPLGLKIDGREVAVIPMSPLANAQKLDDVTTIAKTAEIIAAALGPAAVARALSPERTPSAIAELLGVPSRLIPTPEEIQAMQQEAAEAAQAEMIAKSPAAAQIAGNLTRAQPAPQPVA